MVANIYHALKGWLSWIGSSRNPTLSCIEDRRNDILGISACCRVQSFVCLHGILLFDHEDLMGLIFGSIFGHVGCAFAHSGSIVSLAGPGTLCFKGHAT